MTDDVRFRELRDRFTLYFIGRNELRHLAQFAGILKKAVLLEKKIEAALVFDGYDRDVIFLKRNQSNTRIPLSTPNEGAPSV